MNRETTARWIAGAGVLALGVGVVALSAPGGILLLGDAPLRRRRT